MHQQRTSLSVRSLRKWITDPVWPLPAYRVKGKLLFKAADVDRWISAFRVSVDDVDAIASAVLADVTASKGCDVSDSKRGTKAQRPKEVQK